LEVLELKSTLIEIFLVFCENITSSSSISINASSEEYLVYSGGV
jgi:hypothetical protein